MNQIKFAIVLIIFVFGCLGCASSRSNVRAVSSSGEQYSNEQEDATALKSIVFPFF